MNAEAIYEIARYRDDTDSAELIDRVELVALPDGVLSLRYADGHQRPCAETDACAVIAAEPDLHGVRADEVTRIQATPQVVEQLPLLLRGCDDAYPDEYQVCVAEKWWDAFTTTDGLRIVPSGDYISMRGEPFFRDEWVHISFIETASRTSGFFTGRLGLITPSVVADFYDPDEDDNQLRIFARGDDAKTVVDWLHKGAFAGDFCADDDGQAMLARLFAETALDRQPSVTGERLAAGVTQYADSFGSSPSAEWSLSLFVGGDVVQEVLGHLSAFDDRLADIVAGAVDPDSAPGRARAAALRELDDQNDS